MFVDLLSSSRSLGLRYISSDLMRRLCWMGKRRVTGSLNHSSHVPETSYERKEAASVCWCSVPVQFISQVFVSTGECTWINRNTEQHDLFAGCCHAPVAKSIILTTLPHTSFAYHTWHVQLTSKIPQCQETSGTKFSNAMCSQIVPQHIILSRFQARSLRLSLNRESPESTQPLPPTLAGESYTFSFSWAGGAPEPRLQRKNKQSRQTSVENSGNVLCLSSLPLSTEETPGLQSRVQPS